MASPSSRNHVCPHQCGCDYSATKKTDLERHISMGVRHRGCTPECPYHNCLAVEVVTPENFLERQAEHRKPSPAPTIPNPKIRTPDVDQDHLNDHHTDLGKDKPPSRRAWGTYHHPQIRSLIAAHGEQLSSGLTDIFRAEVEREVKQRVSEVIFSEATAYCEQLRLRDEALLAAETRCKDLQEQLGLSNQTCCQLQERVRQLEVTEAELRNELNRRLEFRQAGAAPPPLDNRHLAVVYERREGRMLCRLCVDGHSRDEALPVISFKEDVKLSTLESHIQHQHPQDYHVLLGMAEEELNEVVREMSRVGN